MKKLFISQPMRNKTDEEIIAIREKAIEKAKDILGCDVEVISSFFKNVPINTNSLWSLGVAKHIYAKNGFVTDTEPLYIAMRKNNG